MAPSKFALLLVIIQFRGANRTDAQFGLHVLLLTFINFKRTENCGFFFYNFISANEVCLLLYPGFSPQIGDESGFLCTNQKNCETKSQSINDHCVLLISFLLCMCV